MATKSFLLCITLENNKRIFTIMPLEIGMISKKRMMCGSFKIQTKAEPIEKYFQAITGSWVQHNQALQKQFGMLMVAFLRGCLPLKILERKAQNIYKYTQINGICTGLHHPLTRYQCIQMASLLMKGYQSGVYFSHFWGSDRELSCLGFHYNFSNNKRGRLVWPTTLLNNNFTATRLRPNG